jgi:hypothetical protein
VPTTIVETLSDTRVKLQISVSPAELKPSIDHAYQHIAEQVQIKGFRKGKVPPKLIDQRVGRGEVAPERITAVISHLRYHLPLSVQTPSDAAQTVARFMALTGEPMAFQVYHDRLSNVTPADVARVARTYLTDARRSVVTLAPAASAPAGAVHAGPNSPAPRIRRAQ